MFPCDQPIGTYDRCRMHTMKFPAHVLCSLVIVAAITPARADIACLDARVYHKDLTQKQLDFLLAILPAFDERPAAITSLETDDGPVYQVVTTCDEGYDWTSATELDSAEYQTFFDDHSLLGYRPLIVETHGTYPDERYLSVMIDDGVSARGRHRTTPDEWLDERDELKALGYLPSWFSSCGSSGSVRYASIWTNRRAGPGMETLTNLSPEDFTDYHAERRRDGKRLISASVHGTASNPRVCGFFTSSIQPQWSVHEDLHSAELISLASSYESDGWEVDVVTAYMDGTSTRYIAVFKRDPHRTFRVAGTTDPGFESLDAAMEAHMKSNQIPRGALAVVDTQGRLVLARGYTWDSEDVADTEPTNLFRIASVSKTVTAVATMALVEDGLLADLDDPVAALLSDWNWCGAGCLDCEEDFCPDTNWPNMTTRHLLTHHSGINNWSGGSSGDAMGADRHIRDHLNGLDGHPTVTLPITIDDIHEFMRTQGVDAPPPGSFNYSNYGYSLLGRIIEAASGLSYEDYVQQRILDPLCIERMRIGTSMGDADGEVDYHDSMYRLRRTVIEEDEDAWVRRCYGGSNIANYDANGGWIASAVDLASFTAAFRDPADSPILTAGSINEMWTIPWYDSATQYALGWETRSNWVFHTGSIAGTRSSIQRNTDGSTYAVVFNRRVRDADGYGRTDDDIRARINGAAWSGITWPEADYWNDYLCMETNPADITLDGVVDVLDLLEVIGQWGSCPLKCTADVLPDGVVDVLDLLAILENWGS